MQARCVEREFHALQHRRAYVLRLQLRGGSQLCRRATRTLRAALLPMITTLLLTFLLLLSPTVIVGEAFPAHGECLPHDPTPDTPGMYFDPCADLDTGQIDYLPGYVAPGPL